MKIVFSLFGLTESGQQKPEPEFRLESRASNFTPAQVWSAGERYGQVAHAVQGLAGNLIETPAGCELHLVEPSVGQLRSEDVPRIKAEVQAVLDELDGVSP